MDATYFDEMIIDDLKTFCCPERRNTHERYNALYFDNASMHNSKKVRQKITFSWFTRLKYPSYSPDLAVSDIILFEYIKEKLKGKEFTDNDVLSFGVRRVSNGISPDLLSRYFVIEMRDSRDTSIPMTINLSGLSI
jgi:hypothetical protein